MQGLVKDGEASLTPVTCQFPEPTPVLKLSASLNHSSLRGPGLTSRGQTQPVAALHPPRPLSLCPQDLGLKDFIL